MSDERRERYAAAIQRAVTDGIELNHTLPEVLVAADAAMSVADAELERASTTADSLARALAKNQMRVERVRAAARKAKDSGNVWDMEDLISAALDGTQ